MIASNAVIGICAVSAQAKSSGYLCLTISNTGIAVNCENEPPISVLPTMFLRAALNFMFATYINATQLATKARLNGHRVNNTANAGAATTTAAPCSIGVGIIVFRYRG